MKAKEFLCSLDQIKQMVQEHTDSEGEFPADPIRMKIILEFCQTEIKQMIDETKSV